MSKESIAEKIQPHLRFLIWVSIAALVLIFADWQFDILDALNFYVGLVISLVAMYALIAAMSADLFVSAFHPQTGFLRPSSKWSLYFPWLQYVILLVIPIGWVWPAVAIVSRFN